QPRPPHAGRTALRRHRGVGGGSSAGGCRDGDGHGRGDRAGARSPRRLVRCAQHHPRGAVGYFALQAANAGMAGIVMSASGPMMAYPGAKVAAVSSNPLAVAFPAKNRPPLLVDMSTSTVAMGKVMSARDAGREIPLGWGLDAQGRDTTDLRKLATLLPLGGPKGS